MPNWKPGDPERRQKAQDHDTLIELVTILNGHVTNFNQHRIEFNNHIVDDTKRFDFLQRSVWMIFGGIAVLELFVKVVK